MPAGALNMVSCLSSFRWQLLLGTCSSHALLRCRTTHCKSEYFHTFGMYRTESAFHKNLLCPAQIWWLFISARHICAVLSYHLCALTMAFPNGLVGRLQMACCLPRAQLHLDLPRSHFP